MAGEEVTSTQRWALKVSIHCEGCKRKVQKIISNIEGVERVDIDLKQHKVSVQGKVDPQTVIWKLEKAGKHAELWPQKGKKDSEESKKPNKVKDKNKDKQKNSPDKGDDGEQSGLENRKVESSSLEGEAKHEAEDGKGGKAEDAKKKGPEMVHKPAIGENGASEAEKGATTVPDSSQSPTDVNGGKTVEGNGGNKKKNKGQNRRKEMSEIIEVFSSEKDADAAAGSAVPGSSNSNNGPANHGTPRHCRVQHPEHNDRCQGPDHGPPPDEFPPRDGGYYNYPQPPPLYHGPPVYAVNYHAAHPSRSYGASQYYAPQPPMNTYHGYMNPRHEEPRPYYDPYYQRTRESFQLFSDENPNSCSLM